MDDPRLLKLPIEAAHVLTWQIAGMRDSVDAELRDITYRRRHHASYYYDFGLILLHFDTLWVYEYHLHQWRAHTLTHEQRQTLKDYARIIKLFRHSLKRYLRFSSKQERAALRAETGQDMQNVAMFVDTIQAWQYPARYKDAEEPTQEPSQ